MSDKSGKARPRTRVRRGTTKAKRRVSFEEIHVRTWDEYQRVLVERRLDGWAFRGQGNAEWPLFSSLSRFLNSFAIHRDAWKEQEARIIRIFRRKAYLFLDHVPAEGDTFEWVALMQHHGAPTRLLDFTWSPYVAAFFALERATSDAAVWLFHPRLVREDAERVLKSAGEDPKALGTWKEGAFERFHLSNAHRFVNLGEAFRMNKRLVAQSGTFATPGVLDTPLEELVPPDAILKLRLDTTRMRDAALRDLYLMNMTHATLFPDLDGLARSLAYELENHWAFDPRTMKPRPEFEDQ